MKKMDFGAKLIEVRKAKGWTQEEVAEKCKITVRTIQRIESGVVNPRTFTIKIISDALGFDFFEASSAPPPVDTENQSTSVSVEGQTILSRIKKLFDFRVSTFKKVSILSASMLTIVWALFVLIPEINAQAEQPKNFNSILIQLNEDKTVSRIEVSFSNRLTFDSLVVIRNSMKAKGITINYKRIEFEKDNHLSAIDCEMDCNDGHKGGVAADSLNYKRDTKIGFCRDYAVNAIPFRAGSIENRPKNHLFQI